MVHFINFCLILQGQWGVLGSVQTVVGDETGTGITRGQIKVINGVLRSSDLP